MGTSAGRSVIGRDEFKPIQKWSNKTAHPSQVLLLKYHTHQTLEIMERCSGESNKPVKRVRVDPTEIVDLTEDENMPRILSGSSKSSSQTNTDVNATSSSSTVSPTTPSLLTRNFSTTSAIVEEDEVVNEEVTVVRQSKQVPILDISDEHAVPQWSFTSL